MIKSFRVHLNRSIKKCLVLTLFSLSLYGPLAKAETCEDVLASPTSEELIPESNGMLLPELQISQTELRRIAEGWIFDHDLLFSRLGVTMFDRVLKNSGWSFLDFKQKKDLARFKEELPAQAKLELAKAFVKMIAEEFPEQILDLDQYNSDNYDRLKLRGKISERWNLNSKQLLEITTFVRWIQNPIRRQASEALVFYSMNRLADMAHRYHKPNRWSFAASAGVHIAIPVGIISTVLGLSGSPIETALAVGAGFGGLLGGIETGFRWMMGSETRNFTAIEDLDTFGNVLNFMHSAFPAYVIGALENSKYKRERKASLQQSLLQISRGGAIDTPEALSQDPTPSQFEAIEDALEQLLPFEDIHALVPPQLNSGNELNAALFTYAEDLMIQAGLVSMRTTALYEWHDSSASELTAEIQNLTGSNAPAVSTSRIRALRERHFEINQELSESLDLANLITEKFEIYFENLEQFAEQNTLSPREEQFAKAKLGILLEFIERMKTLRESLETYQQVLDREQLLFDELLGGIMDSQNGAANLRLTETVNRLQDLLNDLP